MRGGVSLVQQVFPPRAEGFPLHERGFYLMRSLHSASGYGWAAARAHKTRWASSLAAARVAKGYHSLAAWVR
jgi:hypothetical protein